ncbi:hypothetical protein [Pedobacter jejuensis]|uniref:Gliding motility-associated protein GldM N-terminal domain-containing protein n=1 Tax=Pedobacter jejuensis TaxID=1268550 RepID=A0A3N0BN89_9SPHI|nr:hypothetical protein [Pedobacter jejuensis]RNL49763.1 hypothetical protein D7004_20365 [Pedobacter jejuensis]
MKLLRIIIVCLIFLAGILVGFFFQNFPIIKWNPEIKIYEAFQVCSTLFIGIALPFFIKKWIDDGRVIKSLLVDEAKELIEDTRAVKQKIGEKYKTKVITFEDKQHVLALLSQVENSISNYQKHLEEQFGGKIKNDFKNLKDAYVKYNDALTSGDFMTETFVSIDVDFFNFHNIEYNQFISAIRAFSVKMQKL